MIPLRLIEKVDKELALKKSERKFKRFYIIFAKIFLFLSVKTNVYIFELR